MIINCTGLGAGKLVKDENVAPIGGQVSKVSKIITVFTYQFEGSQDKKCSEIINNLEGGYFF